MRVEKAKLARRLGLPANADESTIRARLAGLEISQQVRAAATAARPAAPRIDAARAQQMTDDELNRALIGTSTPAENDVLTAELQHRAMVGNISPQAARTLGYRLPRVDLAARQGSPSKDFSY